MTRVLAGVAHNDGVHKETDRTRYGLINGVSPVTHEIDDPELQWRLQEFAGSMLTTRNYEPYQAESHSFLKRAREHLFVQLPCFTILDHLVS